MVMVNSSNPENFMPPPLAWHNGIRQIKIYGASESCNCNVVSTGMQTGWLSELDSGPCCAARMPRKERRQLGNLHPVALLLCLSSRGRKGPPRMLVECREHFWEAARRWHKWCLMKSAERRRCCYSWILCRKALKAMYLQLINFH